MFNKYTIQARFFPTLLSSIPILSFQYFLLNEEITSFFSFLNNIQIVTDASLSIIILYFVSQLNRILSKAFFQTEEIYMPTTNFLLFKNTEYSREYKKRIYKKLESHFGLKLPSSSSQIKDEMNARKQISEAMSLARKRIGKGTLLLQHNIEYGFWRNLVGGSILAILFSAIMAYISYTKTDCSLFYLSITLLVIFLMLLVFHKFFIGRAGKSYARVLIQEFMEQK